MIPERLAEIRARWTRYGKLVTPANPVVPGLQRAINEIPELIAHIDAQAVEIERLREAYRISASLCKFHAEQSEALAALDDTGG